MVEVDDDNDEEGNDEANEEAYMNEQKAQLEKEKEAILNNQTMIKEVGNLYKRKLMINDHFCMSPEPCAAC